ncbi:hypothetical protein KCU71_g776, partial [Aureobasidium melanogenum]
MANPPMSNQETLQTLQTLQTYLGCDECAALNLQYNKLIRANWPNLANKTKWQTLQCPNKTSSRPFRPTSPATSAIL